MLYHTSLSASAELLRRGDVPTAPAVGLEAGCTVGCEEGAGKQICHPASLTEVSEYHDMLVLGDTETPSGPVVPS